MTAGSPKSRTSSLITYGVILGIIALVVGLDATGYLPSSTSNSLVTGKNCLLTPYVSQNKTAAFYVPIRTLVASPANSGALYLGTFFGLIVGTNGSTFGYTWRYVNEERVDITGLVINPNTPYQLYTYGHPVTNVDTGIRESCDGGQSWTTLATRPDPHEWVVSESNSSTMYATDYPTNVLVSSTDGGHSWNILPSPSTVFTISISPNDSKELLVGTSEGPYFSLDGGLSWHPFARGALRGNISAICYDTLNPQVIYASTNLGLMKTTNGGRTWSDSSNGLASTDVIRYISVDPLNTEVVFAASLVDVYKSVDGGTSWKLILG